MNKVVFFGASKLGYACCEALLEHGVNVVGIFTLKQEYSVKYRGENERVKFSNVNYADFRTLSSKYNIPLYITDGNLKEYSDVVKKISPDLIVVIGWYYMIPKSISEMASRGIVGLHASLLPKYRGNAPLVWAIINGEKQSGVTLFFFDDGVDTGDIIAQESFDILESDTIRNVLEKAEKSSIKLVVENIPNVLIGKEARSKQSHIISHPFPKRTPEDGLIDWNCSPYEIKNFIRAQTKPYPGAFFYVNGKKVIVWDADIFEREQVD